MSEFNFNPKREKKSNSQIAHDFIMFAILLYITYKFIKGARWFAKGKHFIPIIGLYYFCSEFNMDDYSDIPDVRWYDGIVYLFWIFGYNYFLASFTLFIFTGKVITPYFTII